MRNFSHTRDNYLIELLSHFHENVMKMCFTFFHHVTYSWHLYHNFIKMWYQNFWWKHKILQKSIQAQIYAIVVKMWWKSDVREKKSDDVEFRFSAFFQHNFIKETKYNILVQFSCCFLMILSLLFDLSTYPPMYFTEYNFSTKLSEETLTVCCYLLGYPIKLVKKLDAWCRCETSMSVWVRSFNDKRGTKYSQETRLQRAFTGVTREVCLHVI